MIRAPLIAALVLLAGCSQAAPPEPKPDRPAGFALVMPVTPAPGASVQRVALPPAAIAALKSADARDVRIFDASGRVIALARDDTQGDAQRRSVTVPTSAIAVPSQLRPANVSVRVDQAERSVTVDAVNDEADREAHPRVALLLDTRKLEDPAIALMPQANFPGQRQIEVTVERSRDLKLWEPLAARVLFRFDADSGETDFARIALPGLSLKDNYLRLSWQLAPDVTITGASITTAKQVPPPPLVLAASGAWLADPHTLRVHLPSGLPAATLRLTGSAKDGVVPVTLQGRANAEVPWRGLDGAVLRDGKSIDLQLPSAPIAQYQLVADPRSAGFSAAPQLDVLVQPMTVLAAFNGNGPYQLAVGNSTAPAAYFSSAELLGNQAGGAVIAQAQVTAPPAAPVISLAPDGTDNPYSPRKLWLWAALLTATVVLGFAAIRLLRTDPVIADETTAPIG